MEIHQKNYRFWIPDSDTWLLLSLFIFTYKLLIHPETFILKVNTKLWGFISLSFMFSQTESKTFIPLNSTNVTIYINSSLSSELVSVM